MPAIPESPSHWRNEDAAFRRWLIERAEELMAKRLRAHKEYLIRPWDMERLGITEERQAYYWKLRNEFREPRQKAVSGAIRRKEERDLRASAKGEPDSVVKDHAFPKRRVPKGIAG
jgi:hypothetical protein